MQETEKLPAFPVDFPVCFLYLYRQLNLGVLFIALDTLVINYLMLVFLFNMYASREQRLAFVHNCSLASSTMRGPLNRYLIWETGSEGKVPEKLGKRSVMALENIQATLVPS